MNQTLSLKLTETLLAYNPTDPYLKYLCINHSLFMFNLSPINLTINLIKLILNLIFILIVELDKEPGPKELTAIKKAKILYKSCIEGE